MGEIQIQKSERERERETDRQRQTEMTTSGREESLLEGGRDAHRYKNLIETER